MVAWVGTEAANGRVTRTERLRAGKTWWGSLACQGILLLAPALAVAQTEEPVAVAVDHRQEESDTQGGVACFGRGGARWGGSHFMIFRSAPLGALYEGDVGLCAPFLTRPGLLFGLTNAQVGASYVVTPASFQGGGYLQITPLSFLVLRVDALGAVFWPFPVDGSGYFALEGYDAEVGGDALPREEADSATGWSVRFTGVLRGLAPLGPVSLIVLDSTTVELWSVGAEDYYYNFVLDLPAARFDPMLTNEALLAVQIPVLANLKLRTGLFDSIQYNIGSKMMNHSMGVIAMATLPRLPRGVVDFSLFARLGTYTQHSSLNRWAVSLVAGLMFDVGFGEP